jgi:hypothetical protein|tara:strand:+ start:9806 stop:10066 length:261 start_codon:yes stop_codon:yes gene_type:complete
MREMFLAALKSYYVGNINKHLANVEVYMRQPVGVGEHSDVVETLDKEMDKIAMNDDKLNMVIKYLEPKPKTQESSDEKKEAKSQSK